ncbi:MAG: HD domain-containing protein, partial [Gammaproteobacteria bacterium]|nr:HD domain-containing protein [Gammaproteobacteria bacterium]
FDFSGTEAFDERTGYHSQSFLTVPLKNHQNDIIGVLQLLNATNIETGKVVPFSKEAQRLTESLASQAAIALTNRRLIDDLKTLLESLIQLIATAIDEKSPYTGGHCERVPVLTMLLAEAANDHDSGSLKDFTLDDDDRYELNMAAWLHDCGKITTPEAVVDKATKLQTIFDRIQLIEARFEILKRDAQIAALEARLANFENSQEIKTVEQIDSELAQRIEQLDENLKFLRHANIGGEFMNEADQQRVSTIGQERISIAGQECNFLTQDEIKNLSIDKGTLTPEERAIINNHIVVTIEMLKTLPFPRHLKNVPEFAGGHHEKMDGTGYPNGLKGEQMSVQARIMAIADIFEALTAVDRPYKEGKKLSEALRILGFMSKDRHIDPELFKLFIDRQLYLKYAADYLEPSQIDEVDPKKIPGYMDN